MTHGLSHETSNLAAKLALAAALRSELVVLPEALHGGVDAGPLRVMAPGRGALNYSGFTVGCAPVSTYEVRRPTCCPARCRRGRTFATSGNVVRTCTLRMTVREWAPGGAGPGRWEARDVLVWQALRESSLIRHDVASLVTRGPKARCSIDARATAAARRAIATLGGHPITAVHVRAGDTARDRPAARRYFAPRHIARRLHAEAGVGAIYIASDMPAREARAVADAVARTTRKRVAIAGDVPELRALRGRGRRDDARYALFVVESEIVRLADTRITTYFQGRHPFWNASLIQDPGLARRDPMGRVCAPPWTPGT